MCAAKNGVHDTMNGTGRGLKDVALEDKSMVYLSWSSSKKVVSIGTVLLL